MISVFLRAGVAAAILMIAIGCSREDEVHAKKVPSGTDGDFVVAKVGTDTYRLSDLQKFVDLRVDVEYLTNPKFKPGRENMLKCGLFRQGVDGWIERTLLLQVAHKHGCSVDSKELEARVSAIMGGLDGLKKRNGKVAERFTEEWKGKLRKMLSDELLAQAGYAKVTALEKEITDHELDVRFKELENYNHMVQMTNDLVFARATNVWTQLKKPDVDWDKFVATYTEEDNVLEHGEWAVFSVQDLERMGNEFKELVQNLKPGDISAPVENDNGVMILQLASVENNENGLGYRLNRIYFKLPVFYKVPTRDEMKKLLEDIQRIELYKKWLSSAKSSTKVEYPAGKDVAETIIKLQGLEPLGPPPRGRRRMQR